MSLIPRGRPIICAVDPGALGRQSILPTLRPNETECSEKTVPNAMIWSTHSRRSIRSPSRQNNFAAASGFITDAHVRCGISARPSGSQRVQRNAVLTARAVRRAHRIPRGRSPGPRGVRAREIAEWRGLNVSARSYCLLLPARTQQYRPPTNAAAMFTLVISNSGEVAAGRGRRPFAFSGPRVLAWRRGSRGDRYPRSLSAAEVRRNTLSPSACRPTPRRLWQRHRNRAGVRARSSSMLRRS
jgi:hypothetical protein